MPFLAPSTRVAVLDRFRTHLGPNGRVAVGFGAERGYTFDEFFADVERAGLTADVVLESWDLRPFTKASDFVVAILAS